MYMYVCMYVCIYIYIYIYIQCSFLRTALDSLYHKSMGTSGRNYWTAQGHDKDHKEPGEKIDVL